MSVKPYQLSATLVGHDSDVRAVLSPHPEELYTASRDLTTRRWNKTNSNPSPNSPTFGYETTAVYLGHTRYVNSLAYIGPSAQYPKGLILTGGSDKTILVFDATGVEHGISDPLFTLKGHSDNVCCMTVAPNGDLISGSWDSTAKVWRNWQCVYDLVGHQYAVWAVQGLSDGTILTGAADTLIKRWQNDRCIGVFRGHTESVRGLVVLPTTGTDPTDTRFASCSNDGTLRVWGLDGSCLQVLSDHTSFVYTMCLLPTGELVSGGEDRSIKIWSDGQCVQTFVLPAQSIWSVAASPNGDIVVGTSNKEAHVFTRSAERVAPAAVMTQYEEQLAQFTVAAPAGNVSDQKLASPEALQQPGAKDQQVIMVKNPTSGAVMAHQWDQASQKWSTVGTVVDAIEENRRQLHEGNEYDYVFTVDVQEGRPPLKLPYNRGENVYTVAQQFLTRNMLPQDYLDQVAQFITTNAGEANTTQSAGASDAQTYVDPFTGASRYMPGGSTPTGTSSLRHDPFTGGSRYQPGDATSTTSPGFPVQSAFVLMKQCNLPAVVNKLKEFNAELAKISHPYALSDLQLASIDELQRSLETPSSMADPITAQYFTLLASIATQWPFEKRFPALDLLRMLACCTSLDTIRYTGPDPHPNANAVDVALFSAGLIPPNTTANPFTRAHLNQFMLALRLLVNLFAHPKTDALHLVWNRKDQLLDQIINWWVQATASDVVGLGVNGGSALHPCRLALATLLLNLTVYQTTLSPSSADDEEEYPTQLMAWTIELLTGGTTEAGSLIKLRASAGGTQAGPLVETIRRGLTTLGTLLSRYPKSLQPVAKLFNLKDICNQLANHPVDSVAQTARDLQRSFEL